MQAGIQVPLTLGRFPNDSQNICRISYGHKKRVRCHVPNIVHDLVDTYCARLNWKRALLRCVKVLEASTHYEIPKRSTDQHPWFAKLLDVETLLRMFLERPGLQNAAGLSCLSAFWTQKRSLKDPPQLLALASGSSSQPSSRISEAAAACDSPDGDGRRQCLYPEENGKTGDFPSAVLPLSQFVDREGDLDSKHPSCSLGGS